MSAKDLFTAGQLAAAIEAATAEVKAKPLDGGARTFLFELLCLAGELDRAEKQLDAVGSQSTQAEWPVQIYKNIIHAERLRRRLFTDGLKPEFLADPPDYIRLHLDAVNRLREGNGAEAQALLEQSAEAQPGLHGQIDGREIDEFRDCDDVLAPVLELIMLRDYIWLPYEQIAELEISPPERPRDLVWTPVRILLHDGSQRRGYTPVLYWRSFQHHDDAIRLGRATDWEGADDAPVQGIGQKTFLAGEEAVGIFQWKQVSLQRA